MNTPHGFRKVTRDILDLAELQMQLLSVDSQEATRKTTRAAIYAVIGITLAGSALTTTMIGAGFLLSELASWTVGASLLTVAVIFFAIVAGLLYMASRAIQAAISAMSETKSEFAENLKWLKAVLVSPETSPRNQIRAESFPNAMDPGSRERRVSPSEPYFNGR